MFTQDGSPHNIKKLGVCQFGSYVEISGAVWQVQSSMYPNWINCRQRSDSGIWYYNQFPIDTIVRTGSLKEKEP